MCSRSNFIVFLPLPHSKLLLYDVQPWLHIWLVLVWCSQGHKCLPGSWPQWPPWTVVSAHSSNFHVSCFLSVLGSFCWGNKQIEYLHISQISRYLLFSQHEPCILNFVLVSFILHNFWWSQMCQYFSLYFFFLFFFFFFFFFLYIFNFVCVFLMAYFFWLLFWGLFRTPSLPYTLSILSCIFISFTILPLFQLEFILVNDRCQNDTFAISNKWSVVSESFIE